MRTVIETPDYRYNVLITRTVKTTYEQRQERKEKIFNVIKYSSLTLTLLSAGITASIITGDGMAFIATLIVGILYLVYKLGGYKHEYNL